MTPKIPGIGARHRAILALAGIFFAARPESLRTFGDLACRWGGRPPRGDNPGPWRDVGRPGAGQQVLPPAARAGILLLRTHGVNAFRLSQGILSNIETRQRLVEGAYPIRCSNSAPFGLILDSEPVPAGGRTLDSQGGMVLVHLP